MTMKAPAGWLAALPTDRMLAEMSLWSADLGRMAEEIARVEPFTDIYHLDVADGHFSPDLLLFPDLVRMVRRQTAKPLHVHLMVADNILKDQIRQFADAGADAISIHIENREVDDALDLLAKLGVVPGLVLQLQTLVSDANRYLTRLGILTLLGTRIGVKGQDLDARATQRLREARTIIAGIGTSPRVILASDGGNRHHSVPQLRAAGAETVVLGSLAFNDPDLPARMTWLRGLKMEA
jgi:ribulose-phosphate 3-epimerase